jgi:hypothetical protein
VDAGGGEQGADGDLAIGDIEMQFVSPPPLYMSVVAPFAAEVAGCGNAWEHGVDGLILQLLL